MIKPKHIILIVILILVVFLLYRFHDKIFLQENIENFYSETSSFYKDIATNEQLSYIILELTYTDNCAASNQFIRGCCASVEEGDITRNISNYIESNTCKPTSYYIDNNCNLENKSTKAEFIKVINYINDQYRKNRLDLLTLSEFQQEDNDSISKSELIKKSRLPYGITTEEKLAKLYDFKIRLNLIKESNPEEGFSCPNFKLRIPTGLRVTGSENKIDYKDIQYNYNINNIDRIMEFIYKNVDITITNNSITLFDKFYPETNDVYKSSFYHSPRKFTFLTQSLSPKNNFIKKKYEEYKVDNPTLTSTPPYTLQMVSFLIHRDEVERKTVLEKKRHDEVNLHTRFSILWDNVPPTTNNKDNTKLLILLRDPNLIEYYQDDSNSEPLIYWFAWNVNKDDFSIPEKSKSELTSVESFTQLYPYQLFLPDSPQLTNTDNLIVNLKLDVIPITDEINDKLTQLYKNPRIKESLFFYHKQFYREMSKILQQNSIPKENLTPIPSPSQSNNDNSLLEIPYQIKNDIASTLIEKYTNENNNNYKDKTLTAFNYGELVYSLQVNTDKVIKLPHYIYYEIFVKLDNYNSPSQSIIDNRYTAPTPEELLTNNNYTSDDNDIKLSVDGKEVFSIVDGNYIYRIPYQTNIVKLAATAGCKVIIRPSVYKTLPLIWSSIKENKLELSKASKIHLFFKSTDTNITSTDFIVESNSTTKYHSLFSKNNNKDFILPTNLSANQNGTITFLPENFDRSEYKKQQVIDYYNFGSYRINDVNTFNKTICRNDRSDSDKYINSHQILPTIKWDTDLSPEDIKYALEVFYYLPGTTTKKIVYLEWDIDNKELNYEGFKTIRESSPAPAPAPAPATTSGNIKYGPGKDHTIEETDLSTNKNNLYKKEFVRKYGRDCYVNDNNPFEKPENIEIKGNNKKMISIVNGILEGKPLNYIQLTNKTDKYTGDDYNNGFILEYNTNLNIWQLWFEKNENGIKEWVANQTISELIFNQDSEWVFAPKYNTTLVGNFDFFDYPNEFNKDKVIDTYKMQNLLKSTLTINDITKGTSENSNKRIYDCSYNKSKIDKCDSLNVSIESPDVSYFKSTLFNIPNISELSEKDKLLEVNTDTGDLFFNLELRTRVHAYKPSSNPSNSESDKNIILFDTYPNLDKKLNRLLSNQVKKNYLSQKAIDKIKENIKNLESSICSNKRKYLMLDEILSEILVNQGNLSKVPFPTMLTDLYSMDVFNMNREISDDLVGLFEAYISNKVYPQNYSSYGNLNLRQNETIINYQIPTNYNDLKCIQHNSEDVISSPNNNDDMKYKILKSQFYTNSKDIKKHIDNITKYLNKDKHYSKIIDCSSFQKNTVDEYNNYLSKLQDEGDLTKIDQLNNDTNIDLYLLDIDYITKPSTDLTPNPSPSTDLTPCPSDNAPSISYSSDARKYICSPDNILTIHKYVLKILKFYEKVKKYIDCSEEDNCPSESTPTPSSSGSSKNKFDTIKNLVVKTTELNKIVKEKYTTCSELKEALSPSNSEEEGKQPAESKELPSAAEVAKYYKDTIFNKFNIFNRP